MKRTASYYLIAIILLTCLISTGCTPARKVIPPLKYQENIGLHIAKTAHLHWVPGRQISSEHPSYNYTTSSNGQSGGGLAGLAANLIVNAVSASIDSHQRKNHPSEYVSEYGKADETVFITSLKDILMQQNVFKKAELTTDLSKVSPKDILIKIYFKTARVVDLADIKLTVNLSITSGHRPPYERTYFAQNDPREISKATTFIDKKTEVSQKLLTMIINGIKQWHEENKP